MILVYTEINKGKVKKASLEAVNYASKIGELTGSSVTAIAINAIGKTNLNEIAIDVEGGKLKVSFEKTNTGYEKVILEGPATFVFEGEIEI
jgi:diaminopimelate epimerase